MRSGMPFCGMPEKPKKRDVNRDVVAHVLAATNSAPINGEDLLDTPELKRQFREAKERERLRSKPLSK